MKKYIILLSAFIIAISGIFIFMKVMDRHYGIENQSGAISSATSSGVANSSTPGSIHGEGTVHQLNSDDNIDNP